MQLKLNPRFKKNMQERFDRFELRVGVLQDAPHFQAKTGKRGLGGSDVITTYAGGDARKKSSKASGLSIADVAKANRDRLGLNYLTEPFKKSSRALEAFKTQFMRFCFGKTQVKRVENALQAVVRNPILRGEYGHNSALTQKIKGFDRNMIDTSQLFRAIKAAVKGKPRV